MGHGPVCHMVCLFTPHWFGMKVDAIELCLVVCEFIPLLSFMPVLVELFTSITRGQSDTVGQTLIL